MGAMSELQLRPREGYDDIDQDDAAVALRGEVDGHWIRAPSPGRGPDDRSCWARVTSSNSVVSYACEGPQGAAYAT